MWSALFPISNHSHIRQLQFATYAFSQNVLQQAAQISIYQWIFPLYVDLIPLRVGIVTATDLNKTMSRLEYEAGATIQISHKQLFCEEIRCRGISR